MWFDPIVVVAVVAVVVAAVVVVTKATYNEFIESLETSDDDEHVHDAPLVDGLPSFATKSEEMAHTAMLNVMKMTAQNQESMVQQMGCFYTHHLQYGTSNN